MTEEKAVAKVEQLTRDQVDLIKQTVAKGATDNELRLFLYQANKRGLDPLTRQIHFIKRRQYNPDSEKYEEVGTIQTGIDGFRVVADRTGKLAGIKRGAIKDDKGKLIGAWAEVYRKDWEHPAREEVSFDEYCQKKKDGAPMRLWATMPETMIKKVAEAAALRMAFPEDLSGIYTHDEMQQADTEVKPLTRVKTEPDAKQAEKDIDGLWPEDNRRQEIEPEEQAPTPKAALMNQPTPEAPESPTEAGEIVESGSIDMKQILADMEAGKFTQLACVSWIRSKANYQGLDVSGKFEEILGRMNEEQLNFLRKEIAERKSMV